MNPKRKAFIWAAVFCGMYSMAVGMFTLAVGIYDKYSPIRQSAATVFTNWNYQICELIAVSILVMVTSAHTMYGASRARKRNKVVAFIVIFSNLTICVVVLYVVLGIRQAMNNSDIISPQALLIKIRHQIEESRKQTYNLTYIPPWLNHVQKINESCCGIDSYRDWEMLWAPLNKTFPFSCCLPTRPNCVTKARDIIYPDLLSNNIKKNSGCYKAIIYQVISIIEEARKFCTLLAFGAGLTFGAVCVLYVVVFCLKKYPDEDDDDNYVRYGNFPKFRPEELTWRNLEFYRVLVRRKKNQPCQPINLMDDSNTYVSTTGSADPAVTSNTTVNFPQSNTTLSSIENVNVVPLPPIPALDKQKPFEYRVDALAPTATTSVVASPPPTAVLNQLITELQQSSSIDDVKDMGEDEDLDRTGKMHNKGFKKRHHRHHHRHQKDWQANDIVQPTLEEQQY